MSVPAQNMPRNVGLALLVAGTFFMENLDATVITPAIPHMAQSFSVSPVDLNAGVSAYMLTLGVFIPVSGWLAERWGPHLIFTAAIAAFTAASALCGITDNLMSFIAARVAQGMGGALMVPVGRLVVLRSTPKNQLVRAIATLTWPALIAPVLGPPLGGLIVEHVSWRWIFYLNLPLGAAACFTAYLIVPKTRAEVPAAFDWTGFAWIAPALLALLYAIDLLGRPNTQWLVAGCIAAVGIAMMVCGIRHIRKADNPIVSLAPFSAQTFAIAMYGGSLFRMGVSAVPFLIPLMFQIGLGMDPFYSGLMLMAVFVGNIAMKPMTTPLMKQFGFRRIFIVNGALNAISIALCALITTGTPIWISCVILLVGGMTRSMQFTALNTIAFVDIPQSGMPSANTLFSSAFQLSMGMGVALGAICWRFGEKLVPAPPQAAFHVAFIVVAIVSLIGMLDTLKLPRDAGDVITKKGG